jgi:hypothetical protein
MGDLAATTPVVGHGSKYVNILTAVYKVSIHLIEKSSKCARDYKN